MCCFYPTMLNGLFAIWSPVFLPKVPQAMLQIRPPWVVHFAPEQLVHIAPDLLVHFSPECLVHFTADYSESLPWVRQELALARPRLVITLGAEGCRSCTRSPFGESANVAPETTD